MTLFTLKAAKSLARMDQIEGPLEVYIRVKSQKRSELRSDKESVMESFVLTPRCRIPSKSATCSVDRDAVGHDRGL